MLALVTAFAVAAPTARALEWPDVVDEISTGLKASSSATRRAAAERLSTLSPTVAGPLVDRTLADPDVDVRVAAASAGARLKLPEITELVLPWLRERDVRLRIAACEVARAIPNDKAVPDLGRAVGDTESPLVRAAAADALGASGSADAVTPLLGRLDDPSPVVRVQVVRALAKRRDPRAVVPLIGKAQDSAPEVRQAVARALGDLADARAVPTLLQLVRDTALDVKVETLSALGRMRADGAVSALSPLAQDRVGPVRAGASGALGAIGTPDAVRVLVGLLGQGDDAANLETSPIREAVLGVGDRALKDLASALDAASTGARATSIAWVLGELHAASEAPRIVAALRRGTLPPAAALHALAGAGDAASVPVVLEFLSDASPVVRAAAARAALALLDPATPDGRAVEPIVAALRGRGLGDADRARLALLLGRTGAARAALPLVALLGAREPALRLAAVEALGQLGPTGNDDALLTLLRAPEDDIRLAAAIALGRAGGDKAREALLALVDGGDGVDRAAVLTALGGVLARTSTDEALHRIDKSLDLAAGGDRDALLLALGRSKLDASALRERATAGDDDDRRTIATALGAVVTPERAGLLDALCTDADASVRAQAAFAASFFPASAACDLGKLAKSADADVATNAVLALARRGGPSAGPLLCGAAADPRPLVRANAMVGLTRARARCDGFHPEAVLAQDASVEVRVAAARALWTDGSASARAALAQCTASDRSPRVAAACTKRPAPIDARRASATEIFVLSYGTVTPRPRAVYVLEMPDGLFRVGTTDRRGAVFDPAPPSGAITLRRL